jgi:methionyl-tRNA synthetase
VWLHEYLQDFPGKQDVLRYALCATAPETKDNDFTWKDFQDRNNNELVAILGNFVNRTLVLCEKYYGGKAPARGELLEAEKVCLQALTEAPVLVRESIEKYRFREALSHTMDLARAGNKYLADTEPWKHQKTNPEYVETVLSIALEVTAALAYLCEPFLPFTAAKLRSMLNIPVRTWEDAFHHTELEAGHVLGTASLLFEKIEDDSIQQQIQKLEKTKEAMAESSPTPAATKPIKPATNYDTFSAMDLRVATIVAAEKVEKADKLLKLTLDTGVDTRTVVSGIALHFNPEEIVGRQVTLLANLEPRKIRGIESNGMILMAEDAEGKLVFVQPGRTVDPGSSIS